MVRKRLTFKLKYKIALLVITACIVSVGTMSIFTFNIVGEYITQKVEINYLGRIKEVIREIRAFLDGVKDDIHFLSHTPPVQGIIRAIDNNGYDPLGKSTYEEWIERLKMIFKEMALAKSYYMQIRLIDQRGMELVRVDSDGTDVRIVPDDELQDKSSRYYFSETMKLSLGNVYVSPIDLNRERGRIEVPHKLTIRYAMPVFDYKGKPRQMLIINLFADRFLNLANRFKAEDGGDFFISDQHGVYLYHSKDPSKEWGGSRDLRTGEGVVKDYPEVASKILSGRKGSVYSGERQIFYSPLKISDKFFIVAGIEVPKKIVEAPLFRLNRFLAYLIVGILVMTGMFSVLFSRSILRPLQVLNEATDRVARGDFDGHVKIASRDEIQHLADNFDNMIHSLKKKTERLRKLYELGISTGKTSTEVADQIVSIVASVMGIRMATVEKIQGDSISLVSFYHDGSILHGGSLPLEGSPCADVVKEKSLCQYQDVAEEFPQVSFLQEHRVNSYLGVPVLSSGGEVMGVIAAMDTEEICFSEEDQELLYTLSRRIAFEWEQENNIKQIEFNSRRLHTLYKIASAISQSIDMDILMEMTLKTLLDTDFLSLRKEAGIFILDEKSGQLALASHLGLPEDFVRYEKRVRVGECLCGRAFKTGELIVSPNSERNPAHTRKGPEFSAHGDIVVPLKSREKILGCIFLHTKVDEVFQPEELEVLETVGNQLGIALENALLFKKIQGYSAELEKKVEERTKEIRAVNEKLERANRAKSDFLASMSHELRTPLNAIIGFSQVLQDGYFGQLNPKQSEYVNDILESGKHLLSLINDILDLAKVETGREELNISRVNVKALLEGSLVMIKEKCLKHRIGLDLQIPQEIQGLEISADERKLKQVLFNLLSNAAKFTPDGGRICLFADLTPGPKRSLRISVEDTGIGIAEEDREKIFEEFYQVKGGIRDKTSGTGLGLSLAKRFVELHGGRIWVESEGLNKGSRFTFELPIMPYGEAQELDPEGGKRPVAAVSGKEVILDNLTRAIGLSRRHSHHFAFCRFHFEGDRSKENLEIIMELLEKEKRCYDLFRMDKGGNIYLILQDTDRKNAEAVCDRLKEKIEKVIDGLEVSPSVAIFPEDGKTAESLLKTVIMS